jgi:hypothetical protein
VARQPLGCRAFLEEIGMRERLTYRRNNIAAAHLSLPLHHQQERHVIDNPRLKETASRSNENFGWIRR